MTKTTLLEIQRVIPDNKAGFKQEDLDNISKELSKICGKQIIIRYLVSENILESLNIMVEESI